MYTPERIHPNEDGTVFIYDSGISIKCDSQEIADALLDQMDNPDFNNNLLAHLSEQDDNRGYRSI